MISHLNKLAERSDLIGYKSLLEKYAAGKKNLFSHLIFPKNNRYEKSLLEFAIVSKKEDVIRMLLEKNIDINIEISGMPVLHYAISQNMWSIANILYEKMPDSIYQNVFDSTSSLMDILFLYSDFKTNPDMFHFWAHKCIENNIQILRMEEVLNKYIDSPDKLNLISNIKYSYSYPSPLLLMTDSITSMRFLIGKGADINAKTKYGKTALIDKCIKRNRKAIELLLEYDVDINAKDSKGNTALHYVARSLDLDIAEMLLNKGADMHILNQDGYTAALYCLGNSPTKVLDMVKKLT